MLISPKSAQISNVIYRHLKTLSEELVDILLLYRASRLNILDPIW